MKIISDRILANNSLDATLSLEGGRPWAFAQRELAKLEVDMENLDYFEIGPKHGLHTQCIDLHNPKSITCVEHPSKLKDSRFLDWQSKIKNSNFKIEYIDFEDYETDKVFDVIFYSAVIYHNIDQIGQLRKINSLAKKGSYLIFESSTSRNESLLDKNVIEVHYPPYSETYRNVKTCIFHPTKLACKSMLELTGWEILGTCEDHDDFPKVERINIICKKVSEPKNNFYE